MNADAEHDALVRRQVRIAHGHAILHLDCAAHRVDHATEFDDASVPGALDDADVVLGDRGVDEITSERSEPSKRTILVGAGEPGVPDNVGHENRRELSALAHRASLHPETSTERPSNHCAAVDAKQPSLGGGTICGHCCN